jgi:hypothetical protein
VRAGERSLDESASTEVIPMKRSVAQRWIVAMVVMSLVLGACAPNTGGPASAEAPAGEATGASAPFAEDTPAPFVAETDGPPGFSATLAAPDVVRLSWEAVDGAAGYELQVDDGQGGFVPIAALPADETSFDDLMAPESSELIYRIVRLEDTGPAGASSVMIVTQARQPQPITVSPTYDEPSAVTGTIGPEGGTLELTDGNGVTYTLEIPAGSLAEATEITMIPVTAIDGWPLDGESLAAVRIEPEGTQLASGATLLISGSQPGDPSLATVGVGFDASGQEFHLRPVLAGRQALGGVTGSGHVARPARQISWGFLTGVSELGAYGIGQISGQLAGNLVANASPTDAGSAAAQKQAAADAADDLAPITEIKLPTDPTRREAESIKRDMVTASDCDKLKSAVDRAARWSEVQRAGLEHQMTDLSATEVKSRETSMAKELVDKLIEQIDQIGEDCVEDKAKASLGDIPCVQQMLRNMARGESVFWHEAGIRFTKDRSDGGYGNSDLAGVIDALDKCRPSYRALSIPFPGGSWTSNCIADLTKPYDLVWEAPGAFGQFRVIPTSSGSGRIFEQLHTELQGVSSDYVGAGRYVLREFRADDKGNPLELQLAYTTAGRGKICSAGHCSDFSEDAGEEAFIPILVQAGLCPQE